MQEFRFSVVDTFLMGCGIALNKLNCGLGVLLQSSGFTVVNSLDAQQYILMEVALLKKELKEQCMCLIFDGTTRVGEAVAVECATARRISKLSIG